MKNLATTAIVSAVVAALVASGATYAAMKINGHSIALHSIPLNRIEGRLPRGPRGRQGVPGTVGKIYVTSDTSYIPGTTGAGCPLGDIAIGGGYDPPSGWQDGKPQFVVVGSHPGGDDTGWVVSETSTNYSTSTSFINVYAICVPAS